MMTGNYATERLGNDDEGIARACEILTRGGLVALPTETVYGLAARADDATAVSEIYAAKGRPGYNPLIAHVACLEDAEQLACFSGAARSIAETHWPGPVTLVLPRRADARLASAVTAGLDTVAVRCPAHPIMQMVLRTIAVPLAAPSANRSGYLSPTTADHVLATLDGRIHAVLDAGPCSAGLESTIVAVRQDGAIETLRPGPVVIGYQAGSTGPIEAPGQLASHYSPGKPLRGDAVSAEPGEFLVGFGDIPGNISLSPSGDLTEAARRLYACLHMAAQATHPCIAVAPIPRHGLGRAINDRLSRAAAPQDRAI